MQYAFHRFNKDLIRVNIEKKGLEGKFEQIIIINVFLLFRKGFKIDE